MNSFEELVPIRHFLQEFSRFQYPSVLSFYSDSDPGPSFRLYPNEQPLGAGLHHLTTTATCIESLLDCPEKFLTHSKAMAPSSDKLAKEYAKLALLRSASEWTSKGSAQIYCRCRGLPLVIASIEDYQPELGDRIGEIFKQMGEVNRPAIGESNERDSYPPNAFHSYWGLDILERFQQRFPDNYREAAKSYKLEKKRQLILLWARQELGVEIALHCANSAKRDTDQLAWALAIHTRFAAELATLELEQDFVRKGLECLFVMQESNGSWKHHGPLFHYPEAGNAYCYVFETFATLVRNALSPTGIFVRSALQPYLNKLSQLAHYAFETRMPLGRDPLAVGWSSGHHPNRTEPEAWATASVFSFVQALRRLVGVRNNEVAIMELQRRDHDRHTPEKAAELLSQRGDTWRSKGERSVGQDLVTLFVQPVLMRANTDSTQLEPDAEVIDENQCRSAILFGPPGTSKTTLSQAVADRIRWNYVELHASDFVAEGLPNVHRTTDQIFRRLMELDRCVVLFDEIDELVRRREGETDAFGRFLTTSMLPRLAELWRQRKVIYFVGSNHIEYFDQAIIRGQRFDVLLCVPPPSFERKINHLQGLLNGPTGAAYTPLKGMVQNAFDEALQRACERAATAIKNQEELDHLLTSEPLNNSERLAKFILLRWDQLPELAHRILKMEGQNHVLDENLLSKGLEQMEDNRLDYLEPYVRFKRDRGQVRHDFGMVRVWRLEVEKVDVSNCVGVQKIGEEWWLRCPSFQDCKDLLKGFEVEELPERFGTLRVTAVLPVLPAPTASKTSVPVPDCASVPE